MSNRYRWYFLQMPGQRSMRAWYGKHLGIHTESWSGQFEWLDKDNPEKKDVTAWSPFDSTSDYFQPSEKEYMFNYRVENLVELLEVLKKEGADVIDKHEYGKFGWIMD